METGQFKMKYMYKDAPVCPYCSESQGEFWELGMNDGDIEEVECDYCGKAFVVTCNVSVKYSTRKKEKI